MSRALVIAALLAGCANRSTVGPFVKSVARTGDYLAVVKCMITLEREELTEEQCTIEHVPLRAIPMQALPPAPPPTVPPAPPAR